MGLIAGSVPARVEAGNKEGLLQLVDHAVAAGWSARRACALLELGAVRVGRWQARRDGGLPLGDAAPGPGEALHGLLGWERQAIVELFDDWSEIDRSHRKLAHREPPAITAARSQVLDAAYTAHPERFVRKPPVPPALADTVWINRPTTTPTRSSRLSSFSRILSHQS